MDALPGVKVQPGNAQSLGRRAEQQDAFGFGRFDDLAFLAHGGYLVVLADGMGGMLDGGAASRRAVLAFLDGYAAKLPDEPIPAALDRALAVANREVYAFASERAGEGECGTTLVAAALDGCSLHWIAVGDSRAYHYDCATGALRQLNADHHYGRQLDDDVAAGALAQDEAELDPDREALTSFLGLAEIPEVDRATQPLALKSGDRVLLCSDGVYRTLAAAAMVADLALPAQAAAERLIARVAAADDPYQDNATVALLALDPEPPRDAPTARRARPLFWVLLALAGLLATAYHGGLREHWMFPMDTDQGTVSSGSTTDPAAAPHPAQVRD